MAISVRVNNDILQLDKPITFLEIANMYQNNYKKYILLVLVNHNVFELGKMCKSGDNISFIFYDDNIGYEAYARTGLFVLFKAIYDTINIDEEYAVLRFIQNYGYFVNSHRGYKYTDDDVFNIRVRYDELVKQKKIIKKYTIPTVSAMEYAKLMSFHSRELVLKYRLKDTTNYYMIDDLYDYYYDQLLYDIGYIKYYSIEKYKDGIIIIFPDKKNITEPIKFEPIGKMFDVQYEGLKWSESLNVNTVGLLNEKIAHGEFDDLVIMQESYQAAKIANIQI